jgi:nucleotide-binding universal stress UspA family protein
MIQSILCAIDISQPGAEQGILRAAHRWSQMEGASLGLLTVVPDYRFSVVGSYFSDDHTSKVVSETRAVLHKLTEDTLGAEESARIRHVVAVGSVYEEILKTARAAQADMIVIGAHKPDLKDYLLGPNASRVARHAECSVFVYRGGST